MKANRGVWEREGREEEQIDSNCGGETQFEFFPVLHQDQEQLVTDITIDYHNPFPVKIDVLHYFSKQI